MESIDAGLRQSGGKYGSRTLVRTEGRPSAAERKPIGRYWMPLKDDREVYVHFGIGVAESMGMKPNAPAATAELVDLPH